MEIKQIIDSLKNNKETGEYSTVANYLSLANEETLDMLDELFKEI